MTYHHLSQEERYQISVLLKARLSQAQISANLGRHKSTISREISRNSGLRGYRPGHVRRLAENRVVIAAMLDRLQMRIGIVLKAI